MNVDSINNTDSKLSEAIGFVQKSLADLVADPLMQLKPSKKKQIAKAKEHIALSDIKIGQNLL